MLSAKNSGDEQINPGDMLIHDDENPGCVKAAPPAKYQYQIKDSGERQHFDSGAQRDTQKGKGRYDLLPTRALRRLACHYEGGAAKYGDDNWLKGMPMKRFAESAMRHLCKALEGQKDEDHWTAAAWNILAIVEYQERIALGLMNPKWDDLPTMPRMWPDAELNPRPFDPIQPTEQEYNG